MSVNKVIIIGRAGKDVEFKQVSDTFSAAKVSIAIDESYKDKNGQKVEKTEWVNCVGFNNTASLMSNYVHKGDLVYFEGKLQTCSWDDKEGKKQYATEIVVSRIDFLTPKKDNSGLPPSDLGNTQPSGQNMTGTATDGNDPNLPF